MLSVFFGSFSWRLSPFIFRFFRVLPVLGILFGGFFGTNFGLGVRRFWGGFLGLKCPFLRPKNGLDKVLPFLGFFRSSIFVTARFCGGIWAVNSVSCIGCASAGSGCAFLYGFTYLIQGVPLSCRSRDSGAAVSGSVFLLLSSSSFVFPLSFSGPAWVLFLCFLAFVARTTGLVEAGQAEQLLVVCLLFLFSLPGSAPLFLALFFLFLLSLPLSLSLSLSLSFFLLHARHLTQTYPQYCWQFHDRLVRPSPGPLLQRGQPFSRGEFLDTLCARFRGLSGFFRNFDRTVPAVLGV